MAVHLTPEELSEALGIAPRHVVSLCVEHSVPIYNGRIDKTLFVHSVNAGGGSLPHEATESLMAATG